MTAGSRQVDVYCTCKPLLLCLPFSAAAANLLSKYALLGLSVPFPRNTVLLPDGFIFDTGYRWL